MTKADEAVALFQPGFTCSQAVLSVFAKDFGLDRDTALRISQGFGAGIARTGDICGALWCDHGDRTAILRHKRR
jgi:hypothetical protein